MKCLPINYPASLGLVVGEACSEQSSLRVQTQRVTASLLLAQEALGVWLEERSFLCGLKAVLLQELSCQSLLLDVLLRADAVALKSINSHRV